MSKNRDLRLAKSAKKDEFYTQLSDIEKELLHYKDQFENKTIFCNCDDPEWSNFVFFFVSNFKVLKIRKLITTHYEQYEASYKLEIDNTETSDKVYRILNEKRNGQLSLFSCKDEFSALRVYSPLNGNGDFRSEECIELLRQSDIVVTNPPFSLFREYVAQLVEYDKKFVIIGNQNAITYKEIFALIKANRLWLGHSIHSGDREFMVPRDYPLNAAGTRVDAEGNHYLRIKGVRWFTNLDCPERNQDLVLYKKYTPDEYPKYDNYDAINVDKVKDIPVDYFGAMGVPITFLDKYNPSQFKIEKFRKGDDGKDLTYTKKSEKKVEKNTEKDLTNNGKYVERERERERERVYHYFRVIIRRLRDRRA